MVYGFTSGGAAIAKSLLMNNKESNNKSKKVEVKKCQSTGDRKDQGCAENSASSSEARSKIAADYVVGDGNDSYTTNAIII